MLQYQINVGQSKVSVRLEDLCVNATELCQAGNKKVEDWMNTIDCDQTINYWTRVFYRVFDAVGEEDILNKLMALLGSTRKTPNEVLRAPGILTINGVEYTELKVKRTIKKILVEESSEGKDIWVHSSVARCIADWISQETFKSVAGMLYEIKYEGVREQEIRQLLGEGEEELKEYHATRFKVPGYIYCISNLDDPTIRKVAATKRDPSLILKEMIETRAPWLVKNNNDPVIAARPPTARYVLEIAKHVSDCEKAEDELFKLFGSIHIVIGFYRVQEDTVREAFEMI